MKEMSDKGNTIVFLDPNDGKIKKVVLDPNTATIKEEYAIHKQKQMKDDLEKIKGIISPIFYEPYGDDEEYINDIKQITKKY
eukprot:SAG22_NODE_2930_length_2096_cov_157.828743_2_plen_82_part_00